MNSKIISGVIALTYIIFAFVEEGAIEAGKFGMCLILPLACIWFSEDMGNFTGSYINGPMTRSPGCLVAVFGWLLLLLPVILAMIFTWI